MTRIDIAIDYSRYDTGLVRQKVGLFAFDGEFHQG